MLVLNNVEDLVHGLYAVDHRDQFFLGLVDLFSPHFRYQTQNLLLLRLHQSTLFTNYYNLPSTPIFYPFIISS